jgi:hypothetical protein
MTQPPVRGIDHVVVVVRDIDAARATCERLGFQIQPRSVNARMGTANHLMVFGGNYVELLGFVEPNAFNADRRAWLDRTGGGIANAALRTDAADDVYRAWSAAGLQPDPVMESDRAVDIRGRQERAAFRTVRLGTVRARLLGFLACEHRTPQFVYRPEWAGHANGATALAGITVIAADPATDEAYLRKVFGSASVHGGDGALTIDCGGTPIRYVTSAGFQALHPGIAPLRTDDHPALLSFAVADPARTAAVLRDGGMPHETAADGRILVQAASAGMCIEFRKGQA